LSHDFIWESMEFQQVIMENNFLYNADYH
jgi:hypothetical protein